MSRCRDNVLVSLQAIALHSSLDFITLEVHTSSRLAESTNMLNV